MRGFSAKSVFFRCTLYCCTLFGIVGVRLGLGLLVRELLDH